MAKVTKKVAAEIAAHEGVVLEAYKDSVDVWTWGIGVTNASGHTVHPRYLDKPQTMEHAIKIFMWLLDKKYAPAVRRAFKKPLTEAQFAAALSFHYNTGAIGRATWVKSFNQGNTAKAKKEIMNWRKPAEIIGRRKKERDLFFDGKWSNNGTTLVYPVSKKTHRPLYSKGKRVKIFDQVTVPEPKPPHVPEVPETPEVVKPQVKISKGFIAAIVAALAALFAWIFSGGQTP